MSSISLKALLERAHSKPQSYKLKDGTEILLRKMTAAEAEEYFESQNRLVDGKREFSPIAARAKLIALCVTDESGGRITAEDAALFDNDFATEVADLCREANGMDVKVQETKKDLPPMEGGSGSSKSPQPSGEQSAG